MAKKRSNGRSGAGIDYLGGPVVDPTENVKALSEAASKRQDDLREALAALDKARIDALAEQLRRAEQYGDRIETIHSTHAAAIHASEQERLRTVREIDVAALTNLSHTVTTGFESLRNALQSTASRIEASATERANAISDRVTQLERTSYEGKGKEAVSDPLMNQLLTEVKNLREAKAGISTTWVILIGAATVFAGFSGILSFVRSAPSNAIPQQPQVVYVPAAPGTLIPSAPIQQPAR